MESIKVSTKFLNTLKLNKKSNCQIFFQFSVEFQSVVQNQTHNSLCIDLKSQQSAKNITPDLVTMRESNFFHVKRNVN